MIAWPDLSREAGAATQAGGIEWPRQGGRRPVAPPPEAAITETPMAGHKPYPPAEAALEERPAAGAPARMRRKRWTLAAALALSAAAHAGVAVWLAERLAQPGVDAQTDAISVEIVLEQAEPAEVASVAGDAAESSEGGETGVVAPAPATAEYGPKPQAEAVEPPGSEPAVEDGQAPDGAEAQEPDAVPAADRLAGEVPAVSAEAERDLKPQAVPPEALPEPKRPVMPAEPAPPTLTVIDPFRPELATPPVVPPLAAEDIPLELVPVPMRRPEPPAVHTARQRTAEPERKRTDAKDRKPREVAAASAPRKPQPGERGEAPTRKAASAAPAKAQAAGNAALSASSAGAVASYARKVNGHLQRHKRYPADAARQQMKGTVRLAVTVDRSGRLLGARVSSGSGHAVLDGEALATAQRASPYPAPPEGVGGRSLTLAFTLRYGR